MAQRVTATVASFRIWRGSRATLHGLTAEMRLKQAAGNLKAPSPKTFSIKQFKRHTKRKMQKANGGGGIRTPGRLLAYARFPSVYHKPLGHPSI